MIREYIEQQASMLQAMNGGLMETFVLRNGKEYKPVRHSFPMGEAKQCYMNAAKFALQTRIDGVVYCEGYAVRESLGLLMQHAWVVDAAGNAYDLTWREAEECHYYGIAFTKKELMQELHRNGVYGLLDTGIGYNTKLMQRIDTKIMDHWKKAVARESEKFKQLTMKLERSVDNDT